MGRSHLDVRHIATKGEGASVAHHNVTLGVRKVEKSNLFKFIKMRPSRVPGGEIDEKGEICSKLFSVKQNELTHLKVKVLRRHFQSPTTNLHTPAPGHTKVLVETRCWWNWSEVWWWLRLCDCNAREVLWKNPILAGWDGLWSTLCIFLNIVHHTLPKQCNVPKAHYWSLSIILLEDISNYNCSQFTIEVYHRLNFVILKFLKQRKMRN